MIQTEKYMTVTGYYTAYQQIKKKEEMQDDGVESKDTQALATEVEGATLSISEEGKKIQEATTEGETQTGKIGVNAGKLARKIAAAKTTSQLRAVIAEIKSDMQEVKAGIESGMCDKSELAKVESLMAMAQNKMGEVEDREPTPEEESAFAMASLM